MESNVPGPREGENNSSIHSHAGLVLWERAPGGHCCSLDSLDCPKALGLAVGHRISIVVADKPPPAGKGGQLPATVSLAR